MLILGIETSCDETAAAVVRDGVEILSNVVVSQIDIFAEYGGVIPEVAARSHLEAMMPVIDKALTDAKCTWDNIDAIAVTHAPGLLGSLLIGTLTARTLAILHNKPLYAVHHLKSHVYANWLSQDESNNCLDFSSRALQGASPSHTLSEMPKPIFPILALVISGGHTQILEMPNHNQFKIIGTTRDDAVGECFDKVAKILGLPYPGGPAIAMAAEGKLSSLRNYTAQNIDVAPGDPNKYSLPHPKISGLDFSFSGLKTAVLRAVQKEVNVPISFPSHKLKELLSPQQVCDFAASFQKTAIDILIEKMKLALDEYTDVKSIVVAGGVSANKELKNMFLHRLGSRPAGPSPWAAGANSRAAALRNPPSQCNNIFFPAPNLSGDNGAMVAAACYYEIQSGVKPVDPYKLNIYPRISLEN